MSEFSYCLAVRDDDDDDWNAYYQCNLYVRYVRRTLARFLSYIYIALWLFGFYVYQSQHSNLLRKATPILIRHRDRERIERRDKVRDEGEYIVIIIFYELGYIIINELK